MTNELVCIIKTGYYLFFTPDTDSCVMELMLMYTPSATHQSPPPLHQPSSLENLEAVSQQMQLILSQTEVQIGHEAKVRQMGGVELWRSNQIKDFVLKLGFLDTDENRDIKKDGETNNRDKIRNFLHVTEVCM